MITFELSTDKQGRPCAAKAVFAGDKLREKVPQKRGTWKIGIALGFLLFIGLGVLTGRLPGLIGIAYAALSLVTFVAYAWDKSSARRGAWRIPEGNLHLLGLAGGWPGALLAQQLLRHKSKKATFRVVLWVTVLINVGVFVWLVTGERGSFLGLS